MHTHKPPVQHPIHHLQIRFARLWVTMTRKEANVSAHIIVELERDTNRLILQFVEPDDARVLCLRPADGPTTKLTPLNVIVKWKRR